MKEAEKVIKGDFDAEEPKTIQMVPVLPQSCLMKTKHGKTVECKFWIHTDKYFQYFEPGYTVKDNGEGSYVIQGNAVIIPNHEVMYVIIRNTESQIPEHMFLALGGKKKMIEVIN